MMVFKDRQEIRHFADAHRLHLALGYFDGVHLGHQALLAHVVRRAEENGGEAGVLLLEPHPQRVLRGDSAPATINTLEEKVRLIQAFGDIHVFVLPFDLPFAALTPEAFVRDYLMGLFQIETAVCGYNYRFGHKGQGHSDDLQRLGEACGFSCEILPQITHNGKAVSSTAIRRLIGRGAMLEAYARSGHSQLFSGSVVEGNRLGAKLGFPTANLLLGQDLLWPAFGVYGGFVRDAEGRIYRGIVNVGIRPTVNWDSGAPSFEVNLLDFQGDLYGNTLQVALTDRLRPEMAFESLEALSGQIGQDESHARRLLDQWERQLAGAGLAPESIFTCFIRDYPV